MATLDGQRSRRRSPTAAVRWGEASHPGPARDQHGALGDGSFSDWRDQPKSGRRPPARRAPAQVDSEEDLEFIETTEVVVEAGGSVGPTDSAFALRRPLTAYFSYCGRYMDVGVVGAGGFFVEGGNDTSLFSRGDFAQRCRVDPTASREIGSREPIDIVFAAPPSRGLEAGAAIGASLHASKLHVSTAAAIFDSEAKVAVIESDWALVTAGAGGLLSKLRKMAVARGYSIHHRLVSPHRLVGGSEVRSRLFLILVRDDVQAAVGDPPLLKTSTSGNEVHRSVASSLIPEVAARRQRVTHRLDMCPLTQFRPLSKPRRVGAALLIGYFGREADGIRNSVWSIQGAAPPNDTKTQAVYHIEGELVRLTAREEARLRGLPDSVDIGEAKGQKFAKERVREAPSVVSVKAIAALLRDYLHRGLEQLREHHEARKAASAEREGELDDGEHSEGRVTTRTYPSGSAQYCRLHPCCLCDTANETPKRAKAFQHFMARCFVRGARRASVRPGEEKAHARVVEDLAANAHGFRYVYADLANPPYSRVLMLPLMHRTLLFWRFRDEKLRQWARDGAPAFRSNEGFVAPTKLENYASGDGEAAVDFVRGFESDGILERVDTATAKAMLASKWGAVTPVCTIPKASGGFRLLVDSKRSGANWQLAQTPSKFPEPIAAIHSVVPLGGFVSSLDVKDCFYSFPLCREDSWLFMVMLHGIYFRFCRLPQGSRNSPPVCLAFSYGMIAQWGEDQRREIVREQIPGSADFDPSQPAVLFVDEDGKRDAVQVHMDDAIVGGDTFEDALSDEESFLKHLGALGIHLSWKKRVSATQSDADYGGFSIRTDMEGGGLQVRTKEGVADQLHAAALGALGAASNPATTLARLGGLAERVFSLNRAYRAFLARFYGFASRVGGDWRRSLSQMADERKDIREIAKTARADACFAEMVKSDLYVQFGDASGIRAGGAVLGPDGAVTAWTAPLPPRVVVNFGSNIKELRRILIQMEAHASAHKAGGPSVFGCTVFDFTDSQYTSDVLERGKAETNEGNAIIRAIRRICIALRAKLHVFHVAGTRLVENGVDGLSRKVAVTTQQLHITNWAEALAPASPSPTITRVVDTVFGSGRKVATQPLKPGQLKGGRWLVYPQPWSASSWSEAAKLSLVMDPSTDIVVVIPRRGESLWRRPFKQIFVEIGSVVAGAWSGWPSEMHESLHFYHLLAHSPPPRHRDKYWAKHSSPAARRALILKRQMDGPSRVELEQRRLRRALAPAVEAEPEAAAATASAASADSSHIGADAAVVAV